MKKQKTSFWSTVSRAILVLGVISMSSIWLPNQARARSNEDQQPVLNGDQYAYAKINQLKSYGWQVQSTEDAAGVVNFTATKSDPKSGESTVATYRYYGDSYKATTEHTFKDGHKTSESVEGGDPVHTRDGGVIGSPNGSETKISSSTTDPSGNTTTKTYNSTGSKVVQTSQLDKRFNTTTTTDQKGNKIISTPTSTTWVGSNGKTQRQTVATADGGSQDWSFDANGNATGRVTRKKDGTTTTVQSAPGGQFTSVTTDSNGTVTDKHFCDKIANCATPTNNQNQQGLTAAATPKSLVGNKNTQGNNAPTKKLHGRRLSKASSNKGLAGNKKQIRANILNQIQSKGISKGVKEGITADVAKGIGAKRNEETTTGKNKAHNYALDRIKNRAGFQTFTAGSNIKGKAIPKSESPYRYSQGNLYQPKNSSTKNYNARSNSLNLNSSVGSKGVARSYRYSRGDHYKPKNQGTVKPYQFSQGNTYKPKNYFTKTYNARPKSQNWNSSAGSQGTVRRNSYRKFR